MSSGPTLTGNTCIEVTKKQYLNANFEKKDWCGYKGHCRIDQLLTDHDEACLLCKYRIPLDIPKVLEGIHNERIKNNGST